MICQNCKSLTHEKCKGGTWCDCQHRNTIQAAAQELVKDWPGPTPEQATRVRALLPPPPSKESNA